MEIRTLLFADLVLQICCAAGMWLMSRNIPGLKGLRWFAWAYASITAAILIGILDYSGATFAYMFLVIGHVGALLGALLLYKGICEYVGHPSQALRLGAPWVLGYGLVDAALSITGHFVALRLAFFYLVFAGLMAPGAIELARRAQPAERQASRVTSGLLLATSLLYLIRAVRVSLPGAVLDFFAPDPTRFLGMFVYMLLSAGTAFGFVWMITVRLRSQLEYQARTDALTGVLNRRALETEVEREIAACRRRGTTVAVIAMDLDHFKSMNDSFGHAGGDAALCAVAHLLVQSLRRADLVARFGGEEFVAVLPDMNAVAALEIAERLRGQVEALGVQFDRDILRFTASFGVAALLGQDDDWAALLERADRALYAAKEAGRNCALAAPAGVKLRVALGLLG